MSAISVLHTCYFLSIQHPNQHKGTQQTAATAAAEMLQAYIRDASCSNIGRRNGRPD
jgi:hypothetical protein